MSNKKLAVIVAGKMVQDQEFIYPYYRLQEAGYEVDVAVENKEIVYASMGLRIVPSIDICEIGLSPYEILVIPGGAKGMEYMRQDQKLLEAVSQFYEAGGVIASICHGAQILISAKLAERRCISGYYSIKDDINNAGGHLCRLSRRDIGSHCFESALQVYGCVDERSVAGFRSVQHTRFARRRE